MDVMNADIIGYYRSTIFIDFSGFIYEIVCCVQKFLKFFVVSLNSGFFTKKKF